MARPIFDISHAASEEYALRQRILDAQREAGLITPSGALEAEISRATTLRSQDQILPATTVLMGIDKRTQVALLPKSLPIVHRSASILEAPSLGSLKKRDTDRRKILDYIKTGSKEEYTQGVKIADAIDQTERDNEEIAYVISQIQSLVSV